MWSSSSKNKGGFRAIEGKHPYVFLDGLWLKRSWGGEVRNVSLLVAIGVNEEGFREVLAVAEGSKEDKASYAFPREHWRCLRTNNPLERLLREVRRRTRAVGAFPDGKSALMLAAARLRHVAGTKWGTWRYMDMDRLAEASEAA